MRQLQIEELQVDSNISIENQDIDSSIRNNESEESNEESDEDEEEVNSVEEEEDEVQADTRSYSSVASTTSTMQDSCETTSQLHSSYSSTQSPPVGHYNNNNLFQYRNNNNYIDHYHQSEHYVHTIVHPQQQVAAYYWNRPAHFPLTPYCNLLPAGLSVPFFQHQLAFYTSVAPYVLVTPSGLQLMFGSNSHLATPLMAFNGTTPMQPFSHSTYTGQTSSLYELGGGDLISVLPIEAQLVRSRQAYGMDKVWQDEFEQLFSQLMYNIVWTLIEVESNPSIIGQRNNNTATIRKYPSRFRMFIDSAKVRFCCDTCGHGWTSMKGRVVFWYELFQLDDYLDTNGNSTMVGYCAYKLFGQQCDICKVENRFESPMWYPEEVTKVLNNLYNKIGQIYFGFEMPALDKQRRAGKPKTSHNSSLCQACLDGVCTDRK